MTMKKLFIYLFIMTAGLLSATQYLPKKKLLRKLSNCKGEIERLTATYSAEDFFHRLQTVILSPQAMVNAWLQYAPWLQFDRGKNERGEFLPEAKQYEEYARTLINLHMELIPTFINERLRTISDNIWSERPDGHSCMRIRNHGKFISRKGFGTTSIQWKIPRDGYFIRTNLTETGFSLPLLPSCQESQQDLC